MTVIEVATVAMILPPFWRDLVARATCESMKRSIRRLVLHRGPTSGQRLPVLPRRAIGAARRTGSGRHAIQDWRTVIAVMRRLGCSRLSRGALLIVLVVRGPTATGQARRPCCDVPRSCSSGCSSEPRSGRHPCSSSPWSEEARRRNRPGSSSPTAPSSGSATASRSRASALGVRRRRPERARLPSAPLPRPCLHPAAQPRTRPARLELIFWDYLHLGFSNSLAFSPTDVMPLARWTKLAMSLQAIISLAIIGLVIARAVNILK